MRCQSSADLFCHADRLIFILINREAGNLLPTVVFQLRLQLHAGAKTPVAARIKGAAWRRIERARQLTCQLNALTTVVWIKPRRRRQQSLV